MKFPQDELLPKGFSDNEISNFYISKERSKLWNEFDEWLVKGGLRAGIVPSGPQGIGKSGLGLLFASTAYVRKSILLYLVFY